MLEINTSAPNFTLLDENSDEIKLSNYRGKWVVLYFYPKVSPADHALLLLKDLKNLISK